jgi:hypothetical protein
MGDQPSPPRGIYMDGMKCLNYPYSLILRYTPSEGNMGTLSNSPSDGHASTATLLSLDASLAITPRVLRFEASRTCTGPPVRPVQDTGQTGQHWSAPVCTGQTGPVHRSDRSGSSRHVESSDSVLRPKLRNPPSDGFVAKPPNPACKLRL